MKGRKQITVLTLKNGLQICINLKEHFREFQLGLSEINIKFTNFYIYFIFILSDCQLDFFLSLHFKD